MNLQELVKDPKTVLIDVRTPMEYADQHIEGSLNIPLDTVPEEIDRIRNLNATVVLFCRSGARSGQALMYLQQAGIKNSYNAGGISNVMVLKMN
ncbi:MAG TPA: rhodanese-like domain-containing protein [Flavobacteriales bacterium]|nr:sulfurtransferase [Flavobacteriales bacterium]HRE73828.1 rhodanese-like domain-containing protein [Flavobacteriales bacterium]HRE96866.1 rhodanese-like domain-containing protein [Flavobacteriales bacterium]HRJ35808.1 rhodanese-like domain-containing protein [Flavobacteriales bacterium]HRJ38514.1 rhodanese-like domain-containing protein [Flavobacteriales bacterium]